MADVINYRDDIIMDTFRLEVTDRMGADAWEALTRDIGVPDIEREGSCGCQTMRELLRRLNKAAGPDLAKEIMSHVRHGLKPSQFAWAKEKFISSGRSVDRFLAENDREQKELFEKLCATGESFYGQPITQEVLDFVLSQPGMLSAVRKGNELHITAFPFDMVRYLNETNHRKKRYHACHCPFARVSILREGEEVSKTMCYCSLGHAKVMWEAIFERDLDGDVLSSVLGGDLMCKYVIYLPDDIAAQYT